MLGWLVINGFLQSKKFQEIYMYLENASKQFGIDLQVKTTCDLVCTIDDAFSEFVLPDFVLFWDKDIYLARRIEDLGVKVFNSAKAIEICDNKILTGLALSKIVKMPKTIIAPKTFENIGYTDRSFVAKAFEILGSPLIIKEAYGSFGQQVYLANNIDEANKIIDGLAHKDFLMQEFIASSAGVDVRINVVGNKVISAMMRYNENDFRSNITNGGKMKPYAINQHFESMAVKACQAIGLDFAGVDMLFGQAGEPIVCEVNSNPHFKSSFDCTGIDMSIPIMEHIYNKVK